MLSIIAFILSAWWVCPLYTANPVAPYTQDATVLEASGMQELKTFIEWIGDNGQTIGVYTAVEDATLYSVDINNDNEKELVMVCKEGSGAYLALYVFAKDGNVFRQLPVPSEFQSDYAYCNPFTLKAEHFVMAQGKIYVLGTQNTRSSGITRDVYLWDHDTMRMACDPFWLNQQRIVFNQLYDAEKYLEAANFLQHTHETFRSAMDPVTNLWVKNDCARALLRAKSSKSARELLDSITLATEYNAAPQDLKDAVGVTMQLCRDAQETSAHAGAYDYSWLKEYQGMSNNQLCYSDKRIDGLIAAAVPEIRDPQNTSEWRALIKKYIWGPGEQNIRIIDDRYVVFDGFQCCSAQTKALFWCDMQEKVSAVATRETEHSVYITSRSLSPYELPDAFWKSVKQWIEIENMRVVYVQFYAPDGSNEELLGCKLCTTA